MLKVFAQQILQVVHQYFSFGRFPRHRLLKNGTNFPAPRVGLFVTIPRAGAKNPPLAPGFPLRSLPQIRILIHKTVLNHILLIKWITLDTMHLIVNQYDALFFIHLFEFF